MGTSKTSDASLFRFFKLLIYIEQIPGLKNRSASPERFLEVPLEEWIYFFFAAAQKYLERTVSSIAMPVYRLSPHDDWFPPRQEFDTDIVAVGGDLCFSRLMAAYSQGIFPWYNPGEEIVWWCPRERCVLFLDEIKISHSMRNVFNRGVFTFSIDCAFERVVSGCSQPRNGDPGTWISDEIMNAYLHLHQQGFAHSVETWHGKELVGGLYGVSLGRMFFGESMFFTKTNASKAALIFLGEVLTTRNFSLIDCQVFNPHLATLGARNIPRNDFLDRLSATLEIETLRSSWSSFAEFFRPQ